jgi:hypothetical protein
MFRWLSQPAGEGLDEGALSMFTVALVSCPNGANQSL